MKDSKCKELKFHSDELCPIGALLLTILGEHVQLLATKKNILRLIFETFSVFKIFSENPSFTELARSPSVSFVEEEASLNLEFLEKSLKTLSEILRRTGKFFVLK